MEQKKKLGLFIRLPNDEYYEFGLNTKNATFKQLSYILSCLKIMEYQIIEQLSEIEADFEINRDGVDDNGR